ncbi:MAG: hypothetical protein KAI47_15935, partial [Deltaproteobacteria bacterium]|nr:hypothetical protein [Deltaproteobacteria bacterium]
KTGSPRVFLQMAPVAIAAIAATTAFALLTGGCATTTSTRPTIADLRDVARASSAPQITKVIDLSSLRLPKHGSFAIPSGDGKGAIGELLLIWGKNLGRQPAVAIGVEPTDILAHVKGGGVVVRVPWGIPAGSAAIKVTTRGGAATRPLPIRRVGVLTSDKGLRAFALGKDTAPVLGATIPMAGVVGLTTSPDGAAAYAVVSRGGKLGLETLDLRPPTPKIVDHTPLPGKKLAGIARARRSNRVVVITDTHVVYVDTQVATSPALYAPHPLPRTLKDRPLGGVALAPDGQTVALLAQDKNQLVLFNARQLTQLPTPQIVDVLPAARLPLVQSAAFSLDGNAIWVVAGDTAKSLDAGHQAAQIVAFPVAEGRIAGDPTRSILSEALAPVAATMARSAPTPAGTAIRTAIASSALYVTASPLGAISGKVTEPTGGVLLRALRDKPVQPMLPGKHLLDAICVAGRPQVIVALGMRASAKGAERVLLTRPAWQADAKATVVSLGPVTATATAALRRLLVVQP